MYKNHLLSIKDLGAQDIFNILVLAKKLKAELKQTKKQIDILKHINLVMLFEKPSLRTKLSFDTGMSKLGGHAVYFSPNEVGLNKRESVSDAARVMSSMADLIMVRTCKHETLVELANNATVPVINGLSDLEHPCQTLADLLTIWEYKRTFRNLKIAYFGDGENNVTHSLCLGSAIMGMDFSCASPQEYRMNRDIVTTAKKLGSLTGSSITETGDPETAAENADIIYTDTWVSMGDEEEKQQRLTIFKKYQVTNSLMSLAKKDALFMHDLPAYRGNEVTADVIDGGQSVVFQQAENRMWAQMALIVYLLTPEYKEVALL